MIERMYVRMYTGFRKMLLPLPSGSYANGG